MAKKGKKRLHFEIDETIANRLTEHVDSVGYDKSKLIEKILKSFLKRMKDNK